MFPGFINTSECKGLTQALMLTTDIARVEKPLGERDASSKGQELLQRTGRR
jgi:hypothetical protein